MLEQIYRRRLDTDLKRWQAEGTITAETHDAIRRVLGPAPEGVGVATIISIVGGLLIAAAFLTFVAANWSEIPRPARLALLIGAIAVAHGLGAQFARTGRTHLADLSATVGAIVFGATIALVGQMYHLSGDFAAGLFLWAAGALVAALLTQSRGTLAVALVAGLWWSLAAAPNFIPGVHWPFLIFWAVAAVTAINWNAPSARHLASVALLAWWITSAYSVAIGGSYGFVGPVLIISAGAILMLGAGLAVQTSGPAPVRLLGTTLATYGAFGLALGVGFAVVFVEERQGIPAWAQAAALAGAALAGLGGLVSKRPGTWLAALAISLALVQAVLLFRTFPAEPDRWAIYALALGSGMSLLLSGALDENRPRLVAGWIGLGLGIACITWAVEATLLTRALFLAICGGAVIVLALALGRMQLKEAQ